jgi:hypothetical protein
MKAFLLSILPLIAMAALRTKGYGIALRERSQGVSPSVTEIAEGSVNAYYFDEGERGMETGSLRVRPESSTGESAVTARRCCLQEGFLQVMRGFSSPDPRPGTG